MIDIAVNGCDYQYLTVVHIACKRTCLSGSDGKEQHKKEVEENASQWDQVVVVLCVNGDVKDDEDDYERIHDSQHCPTQTFAKLHCVSKMFPFCNFVKS